MEFRSANDVGYQHLQGDLVTNVSSGGVQNSSHGVQLTGGSTGGIVTAAGDETNIALNVRPKGSGPLNLGVSGAGIISIGAAGSTVYISGSTSPFSGFLRFSDTAVATPNFNSTNIMVMETTHVLSGLSTATVNGSPYFVIANAVNVSTDCNLVGAFIGTTAASNEVHCRWIKASTLTVAASTATVNFLIVRM